MSYTFLMTEMATNPRILGFYPSMKNYVGSCYGIY